MKALHSHPTILYSSLGLSGVVVSLCCLVLPCIYREADLLEAQVIFEAEQFKRRMDSLWADMMEVGVNRPPTQRKVRSYVSDRSAGYSLPDCGCNSYDASSCPSGSPGPPGPPGFPGEYGPPGEPGKSGMGGDDMATFIYPQVECPICPAGPPGPPGYPGKSGKQGSKGKRGLPGYSEPAYPGPPGDSGKAGNPGYPGKPGPEGEPGKPGYIYSKGDPGEPGPPGPPGYPGVVGRQGKTYEGSVPGVRGPLGPIGPSGLPGSSGKPGYPGKSGYPGPDAGYCSCPPRGGSGYITGYGPKPIIPLGHNLRRRPKHRTRLVEQNWPKV